MKTRYKPNSKKLQFLLSVCMGISHIVNSQVVVQGQNFTYDVHNYCSNGYITSPGVPTSPLGISSTANVYYTAINYTLLLPGFTAGNFTADGQFTALTGACPVIVSNNYYGFPNSANCTYNVTASVQQTNGSTTNTLPSQMYAIAHGKHKVYSFTPQAGYSLVLSSLSFTAQTASCPGVNFGVSNNMATGNCMSCTTPYQITQWRNMSGSNNNFFEIDAQTIVGGQISKEINQVPDIAETADAKIITGITEQGNGTGIQETLGSLNKIEVYPNPSNGIFGLNMTTETEKNVFVYDVTGRIVFRENSRSQKLGIDMSHSPKGIYVVKVVTDHEVWSEKIVIQ